MTANGPDPSVLLDQHAQLAKDNKYRAPPLQNQNPTHQICKQIKFAAHRHATVGPFPCSRTRPEPLRRLPRRPGAPSSRVGARVTGRPQVRPLGARDVSFAPGGACFLFFFFPDVACTFVEFLGLGSLRRRIVRTWLGSVCSPSSSSVRVRPRS